MTAFVPNVGRALIHRNSFSGPTADNASYQLAKLEAIADALAYASQGWANPWSRVYSNVYQTTELCYTVLERTISGNQSQIVLAYVEDDPTSYLYDRWSNVSRTKGVWICYKPHTTGTNINWATYNPVHSNFISDGGGFKFAVAQYHGVYFYSYDWAFTWLAEEATDRVVLISENSSPNSGFDNFNPVSVVAFGSEVISSVYNTGTDDWRGLGDEAHPEPDTNPELFYARNYGDTWTEPNSLQWYRTDGEISKTYAEGIDYRADLLEVNAVAEEPYPREQLVVWKDDVQGVWEGPSTVELRFKGNSVKGLIDPDFLFMVNPTAFQPFDLLKGGDFLHIREGLCCGWDSSVPAMPMEQTDQNTF